MQEVEVRRTDRAFGVSQAVQSIALRYSGLDEFRVPNGVAAHVVIEINVDVEAAGEPFPYLSDIAVQFAFPKAERDAILFQQFENRRNEPRRIPDLCFDGKCKSCWNALAPVRKGFPLRQPIKAIVDFDGVEVFGKVLKP